MKQLLIIAHGSRRKDSNQDVTILASKVALHLNLPDDAVQAAFLELASPSIGEAIDACFQRGCDEITVLPYFLSPGTHVVSDVPEEIANAQSKWPDKTINLLPHIGAGVLKPKNQTIGSQVT